MGRAARVLVTLAIATGGCASPPSTSLYAHPWPDERLRRPDGTIDVSGFPEGTGAMLRRDTIRGLEGVDGFGTASGFFFPFDTPLDAASLPDVEASTRPDASVRLVNVDRTSPAFGEQVPIDVRFLDDAGPFGGTNLLVVLPFPGAPLDANTLYAAFVTRDVRTREGVPLERGTSASEASTRAHAEAAAGLDELGVDEDAIVARAVVRTDDPTEGLRDAVAQVLAEERIGLATPVLVEEHVDYCVFRSATVMPVYQAGEPPYERERDGGGFVHDDDGALVVQARLDANVWITVPRVDASTLPSAVLVRAGAGGDRPLVDRGQRDADGQSAPGTGIARELAQAGYVGLSVDGPLGGARNLADWDEQTALFNLVNPVALRDNVRQSALELVLFVRALETLAFDASGCDGAPAIVRLDERPVLIGHSTGATIAPLAVAVEPRIRALVMSGAGASWIRQIVHKESPLPIRPFADALVGYWPHRRLVEHDPMLSMIQWAGEPADPLVYGRAIRDRPVLVFQGVVDTYIPPPIANPVAMSLGLDLGGDALDEVLGARGVLADVALIGGEQRALPTALADRPRVVTQHLADGIEDGHEILFQRPEARRQLRCFLASIREGAPRVVAPAALEVPCDS